MDLSNVLGWLRIVDVHVHQRDRSVLQEGHLEQRGRNAKKILFLCSYTSASSVLCFRLSRMFVPASGDATGFFFLGLNWIHFELYRCGVCDGGKMHFSPDAAIPRSGVLIDRFGGVKRMIYFICSDVHCDCMLTRTSEMLTLDRTDLDNGRFMFGVVMNVDEKFIGGKLIQI